MNQSLYVILLQDGAVYTEILKNFDLVALDCDFNSDGIIDQTIAADVLVSSINVNLGDVNGDGIVDVSDASLVLAEYALIQTGEKSSFTSEQKNVADVNKDGIIDSSDASKILAYYADISTGKTPSWN